MPRWAIAASLFLVCARASAEDVGYNPKGIFMPNAVTAIAIARAVLIPIYGSKVIESEEPLIATRQGDIWTIRGTLHCKALTCVGGTAEVKLSAKDGRILHVVHYR